MYSAPHARALNAYRQVSTATRVDVASKSELVSMLFDALRGHLLRAENALNQGQLSEKGVAIGNAVRIIEEGLRSGLDMRNGGEISQSLSGLYSYCSKALTEANFYNNVEKVREVVRLLEPVAQAWKQVSSSTGVQTAPGMVQ